MALNVRPMLFEDFRTERINLALKLDFEVGLFES